MVRAAVVTEFLMMKLLVIKGVEHNQVIHHMYQEQKTRKEFEELLGLLYWNSEHFTVHNSTDQELGSSDLLNIFSNDDLKGSLLLLYKGWEKIATHIKEIIEFSTQFYANILDKHYEYRPVTSTIWDKEFMFNKVEWQYIIQVLP